METLATERLTEQPSESRLYSMDFAALLIGDEVLSSVTSVTSDPAGLTIGTPTNTTTTVSVRLSGGTVNTVYRVEFIVVTDGSNTLESDGELMVHD